MGGYNPMGSNYPPPRGVMEMLHSVRGAVPRAINNLHLPVRNRPAVIDRGFQPPGQLDYSRRAPGIIREDSPVIEDAARARNIDYKAPPPAREGFTRSPRDNDILVCPECQTELGAESTDETREQVWASKCGHVRTSLSLLLVEVWQLISFSGENSVIAANVSTRSASQHSRRTGRREQDLNRSFAWYARK